MPPRGAARRVEDGVRLLGAWQRVAEVIEKTGRRARPPAAGGACLLAPNDRQRTASAWRSLTPAASDQAAVSARAARQKVARAMQTMRSFEAAKAPMSAASAAVAAPGMPSVSRMSTPFNASTAPAAAIAANEV